MSATKQRVTHEEMIVAAKLCARIGGCTCAPNVTLREVRPGVFIAGVAHDDWCAHPSQQKGQDA